MIIEQPPRLYRLLFPGAVWRVEGGVVPTIYLTFDDGPIPEVTPWVLDLLDEKNVKATFFMVGDNVRRHPGLLREVVSRGHAVGNHSMHHVQGVKMSTPDYMADIDLAAKLIDSHLYRPPHGMMRRGQMRGLRRAGYEVIMYDVVTRDYSRRLSPCRVLDNVKRYTRPGSIIVFHDSLKSERNLRYALPRAIDWLREQGYSFAALCGAAQASM